MGSFQRPLRMLANTIIVAYRNVRVLPESIGSVVSDQVAEMMLSSADARQVLERSSQHYHRHMYGRAASAGTKELEPAKEAEVHTHGGVRSRR